ncbi:mannan endo-1,4-beta-mannosidase 1-like isoform X2 [Dioscorea cayenensis subsp. rotundata]|uniref:mannan endo-1,4-beta-mannosidase n=1 Tax=Dioscorea cayennensis subsp. rotundata TaxID=55577 RepID=A0AB40AGU3_DIOCR|nr:mannan endo-1,4-beta-mannosidase 1-like isoform X2 [Dioscorea cayenensis subsp. rotundata]
MANKQLVCALLWVLALIGSIIEHGEAASDFVKADGTSFAVNGESFYPNGFNAYWLMSKGSKPSEMDKVSRALCQASSYGMTVVRTWAFKDGGYRPLQSSPGVYNEDMFKGLDFVISEAKKYGLRLILSMVNNFKGKRQYVEWAKQRGENLTSEDDFYTNYLVKTFYRNHVKTILLRNNTKTGVVYKDDPSIMAWELMNEGRCKSDLSGRTMQAWIEEMAGYVKAIDRNHLLEVGLEGFFGGLDQDQEAIQYDPFASSRNVGSDFISNNQIHGIDFATIHLYPNLWIPHADDATQLSFLRDWIHSHSNAADEILRKPLLVTEFGKTSRFAGCNGVDKVAFYRTAYAVIYKLIRARSACAGGLFWQLLLPGMENLSDGYEIILSDCPSIANIIFRHSRLISSLNGPSLRGLTSTYQ